MESLTVSESEYRRIDTKELLAAMSKAGISQRKLCRYMSWSRGYWCKRKRKGWLELHVKDIEKLQLFLRSTI